MKKYLDFVFPLIVVVCSIVVCILSIPYNVDSLGDEGYLWLCVQGVMDGRAVGGSLWNNMLVAFLGKEICMSIFSLRVANVVLSIVSALLFWLMTHKFVSKNKMLSFTYLIMIMFVLSPVGNSCVLCYNGVSRLFLLLVCAASLRLFIDDSDKGDMLLWALLIGFAITMSFFSILPSAVIVGGAIGLLLVIRFWKQWKKMLKLLGMMIAGGIVALFIVHFFVADLRAVFAGMMNTAQTITKVNRGYDPLSFVIRVLLFFRDISLFLMMSIGIILFSLFLKRNGYSILASLFFILACLVYWHYQKKPGITYGMQLSLLWLLPLVSNWHEKQLPPLKQLFTFDFVLNLFLCLFPLLATLGTNVPLGSKMIWFIIPWVLLSWRLGFSEENIQFRGEALFALSFMALLSVYRQTSVIDASQIVVEKGPLKGMHLNSLQENHFKKVEQIMDEYQFRRGESVVFSTQLSMMTICYLEALPVELYFQPMDFVAHEEESLPIPDYLFLSEYDIRIAKEKLEEMPWGWPQDFDIYEVGSPDDPNEVPYLIEQVLYCRRSLKN